MSHFEVPLKFTFALYIASQQARAGANEKALASIVAPLEYLFPHLDSICSTIEPWQTSKTTSGVDSLVMAGVGWKVSFKIASDTEEPETALILRSQSRTFVLSGDHRQAFESARTKGLVGLMRVFQILQAENLSEFSMHMDDSLVDACEEESEALEDLEASQMTRQHYLALNEELERLELANAKGQDTTAGDNRIKQIDRLTSLSPWKLHPDHGCILKSDPVLARGPADIDPSTQYKELFDLAVAASKEAGWGAPKTHDELVSALQSMAMQASS